MKLIHLSQHSILELHFMPQVIIPYWRNCETHYFLNTIFFAWLKFKKEEPKATQVGYYG